MIKILVDSASDCRKEDNICDMIMPITINIDGKEYLDGIDINGDAFYECLLTMKDFPRTSQPSTQAFLDVFEEAKKQGDEILCFTVSSELSGTYQGAYIAKNMVDYDGIYIVDTKMVTHMIGILVQYAKDLIEKNFTAQEIIDKCEVIKSKIKVFAGVDTLEYLYRGGRLSKTSATVGEIAKIKPILTVTEDGKVDASGKCLGRARAKAYIMDKIRSYEVDENFPIYSIYSYDTENCEQLEEKLLSDGYKITGRKQIGAAIGTHAGPGAYGVIFVTK